MKALATKWWFWAILVAVFITVYLVTVNAQEKKEIAPATPATPAK